MAQDARAFYARYYMLTVLLPPYVMALLVYVTAWLLGPASPWARISAAAVLTGFGVIAVIGLSPLLSGLGFILSGVPRARIKPSADDLVRLHAALDFASASPDGLTRNTRLPVGRNKLIPQLVELGPVPYIAAGGLDPRQLWISTHTLRTLQPDQLRYLIAHEYAHVITEPRGRGCAWYDLLWVAAYPLAWWLAGIAPPLIIAAALLHALIYIKLAYLIGLGHEYRCDDRAVELTDLDGYARAMAAFQRLVAAERRPEVLRMRLRRLGLTEQEADVLIED